MELDLTAIIGGLIGGVGGGSFLTLNWLWPRSGRRLPTSYVMRSRQRRRPISTLSQQENFLGKLERGEPLVSLPAIETFPTNWHWLHIETAETTAGRSKRLARLLPQTTLSS
jgi:hypothetical protein